MRTLAAYVEFLISNHSLTQKNWLGETEKIYGWDFIVVGKVLNNNS